MNGVQQQEVNHLASSGWAVAQEKEDRIEMVYLAPQNGAFSVTWVFPYGGYSWVGSYPLNRLKTMYPALGWRVKR